MKSYSSWLSMVLVLQLVVAGGILISKQQGTDKTSVEPLLAFSQENLTKVVISEGVSEGEKELLLQKEAGNWALPEYKNLPADTSKLEGILKTLSELQGGWPVATSSSSHERFEVDKDSFKKRVQLFEGDKLVSEVFIGTSPSYRKSHVRTKDSDKVFAAELSSFEYSAKQEDWLDKALLKTSDVKSVETGDYVLVQQGETWTFADDVGAQVDESKAKELIRSIENLHVQSLADVDVAEKSELKVSTSSGDFTYTFMSSEDKYYVKRSDFDLAFIISKSAYDNIIQKSVNDLAVKVESPDEEASNLVPWEENS